MMNAAAADLIQRTVLEVGLHEHRGTFINMMREVAESEGTYLDGDVRLAEVVIDELGSLEALGEAASYAPLDMVEELFRKLVRDLQDPDIRADLGHYYHRAGQCFNAYDRGRFSGMIDCYMTYGQVTVPSKEEMEEGEELAQRAIELYEGRERERQELGLDDSLWSS